VLCEQSGVTLVVNDRCDIARLLNAHVHVGQDDLMPAFVRQLCGPSAIIGLSTHNAAQLEAANHEPVDYHAIGPIFATSTKANPDPVVGLSALKELRKASQRPLVAIGGITLENAPGVIEAGADSVAVVSALIPENPTRLSIRERTAEWLKTLNS